MTLREWSLSFPLPLVLLKVGTIKAKYSGGLVFPLQDTRAGEPHIPCYLGRTSAIVTTLLFVDCPPGVLGLECTATISSTHLCGSFFVSLVVDLF